MPLYRYKSEMAFFAPALYVYLSIHSQIFCLCFEFRHEQSNQGSIQQALRRHGWRRGAAAGALRCDVLAGLCGLIGLVISYSRVLLGIIYSVHLYGERDGHHLRCMKESRFFFDCRGEETNIHRHFYPFIFLLGFYGIASHDIFILVFSPVSIVCFIIVLVWPVFWEVSRMLMDVPH